MLVRITGDDKEREEILNLIREKKEIYSVSKPCKWDSNEKWMSIYVEILSQDQIIVCNIRDHQILEYCRQWRSKNDVCKFFKMKFEEAEEILERLYRHGDLERDLDTSGSRRHHHYEYKTIAPVPEVMFADGRYNVDDSGEEYPPVKMPANKCCANCYFMRANGVCEYHEVIIDDDETRSCIFFKPCKREEIMIDPCKLCPCKGEPDVDCSDCESRERYLMWEREMGECERGEDE